MKTMRRPSMTAMSIYGAVCGVIVWTATTLTGTGTVGVYAFSIIGTAVLSGYLMWPERTRFIRDSSAPTARASRNQKAQRRRRRTGAL